jgi:hypothetical protein
MAGVRRAVRDALVRLGVLHRGGRWAIGIYQGTDIDGLSGSSSVRNPVLTAEDVTDARARFVADPFLARYAGAWCMFFEIWNEDRATGEIGYASSADGMRWSYEGRVLVEPFHLSYPYVLEHGGDWYMVPETGETHSVRLYRATSFPEQWELVSCLLTPNDLAPGEQTFVDASLAWHDGHWWIFADTSPERASDTLRLYMSTELAGPYVEHPLSPLVTNDPTRARPAGRIVVRDEGLLRFAQVCRPRYGTGIRAFTVETLTPSAYAERPFRDGHLLEATGRGWNGMGMHTIDLHRRADGTWLAAVDGLSSNHLRWRQP